MKRTFQIYYNGKHIDAEMKQEDKDTIFTIYIQGKEIILLQAEDSDGANRWLDAETNKATNETKEIGIAIEKYLSKYADE